MASAAPKWTINHLCVFCGSASPKDDKHRQGAIDIATEMLKRNIGLVYGGGTHGMMGIVGKTVHEGGGKVLGIIPEALRSREQDGSIVYGEQIIVEAMHERKFMMYQRSNAFVALPGGFGTLDELLEVLTWAQIGIHDRPVGLLNTAGFFDGLLKFIKDSIESGFISQQAADLLIVSDNAADLIDKLQNHVPSPSIFDWKVKP